MIERPIVTHHGIRVPPALWVWIDPKHTGDSHVGLATVIASGFAIDDPISDELLCKAAILPREMIVTRDLVVVSGMRLGVENALQALASCWRVVSITRHARAL